MKKESLGQCSARVYEETTMRSYQCSYKATVTRDGKPFCLKHDPVRLNEHREAREKKYREQWRAKERGWAEQARINKAHEPMLEALKEMVEITTNPGTTLSQIAGAVVKAREAIAKAEGRG